VAHLLFPGKPGGAAVAGALQHPLIGGVIAQSSPFVGQINWLELRRFPVDSAIPEARLRGYREKRLDSRHDFQAEHTGEIIIRYLEEFTDTPARLAATLAWADALHASLGVQLISRHAELPRPTDVVRPIDASKLAAVLQAYDEAEAVEFAQLNYVYRLIDPIQPLYGLPLEPGPRFHNLSVRCQVGQGDEVGIAGIIVLDMAPKRVAFRAQGPSLAAHGIAEPLANPQIVIFDRDGHYVGHNDDWGQLALAERAELAAHGLTPGQSQESAWVGTLPPGAYTVHVSDVGGGSGVGLVESFDLDGATHTRLVNVSARSFVGTGEAVAIAGLWIDGDEPRTVYLRALGPSLAQPPFNLSGVLADPQLVLLDANRRVVATNDNWRDTGAVFAALGIDPNGAGVPPGLLPGDDRKAAMVVQLSPGAYTVILSSKGGQTGIGTIEVFEF
jgi:hypothetical protein